MKILFISDKHPCPPINGLYVPFYEMVQKLSIMPNVIIELALPLINVDKQVNSDTYFNKIHYFPVINRSKMQLIYDFLFIRRPPYSIKLDIPKSLEYDVVIATPDGFVETLEYIKLSSPSTRVILYIGELYSTVSLGQALNAFANPIMNFPNILFMWMKFFCVYFHERRYLARVNAVIVQTIKEADRFSRFKKQKCRTKAFIFSNPIKQELLTNVVNNNSNVILIHAPRSPSEIAKVIPNLALYIKQYKFDVVIRICVNDTKIFEELFSHYECVEIWGYKTQLVDVYQNVFCAIVLTKQRFGLVNRVKEAMTASVAVIGYSETLSTVGDTTDQKNVIYAKSDKQFVNAAIELINNKDYAKYIGQNARQFIVDNEKNTPQEFMNSLFLI